MGCFLPRDLPNKVEELLFLELKKELHKVLYGGSSKFTVKELQEEIEKRRNRDVVQ